MGGAACARGLKTSQKARLAGSAGSRRGHEKFLSPEFSEVDCGMRSVNVAPLQALLPAKSVSNHTSPLVPLCLAR